VFVDEEIEMMTLKKMKQPEILLRVQCETSRYFRLPEWGQWDYWDSPWCSKTGSSTRKLHFRPIFV